MEKLSLILAMIGAAVLIFSLWGFLIILKHIKRFNNSHKFSNSLNDEKYFELKARQDYIIASATIIFAVLSFIGYGSIKDIKEELNKQVSVEKQRLDTLNNSAHSTLSNFAGIEIKGKNLEDSLRSAMQLVALLKLRVGQISTKDVINQNIFIIDPLRMGDFPKDKDDKYDEGFHVVKFSSLITISGQKLPSFKVPPSVICFSSNMGGLKIKEITVDGFIIQLESYLPLNNNDKGEDVKFAVWISQKPDMKSFSSRFSKDFK